MEGKDGYYPKKLEWNKVVPTPNPKALIINVFALSAIENTIIRATIRDTVWPCHLY
jgi:hypothetical protein